MTQPDVDLIEVFSAIQGEGPIVGRRQIFVRFGRCDVVCRYCDTPLCHVELAECRVEIEAGKRDFERHANPVKVEDLARWVARLASDVRHHSVSLTGGEPLLHVEAIKALAPDIRQLGLRVYLETNGHLVEALEAVTGAVDIVGMDIKLASATGFPARHDDNRRFLEVARAAELEVFCKLVVDAATTDDEIVAALSVINDVSPQTLAVIQPVTPFAGRGEAPSPERLLAMNDLALATVTDVVVIPQTHKMIHQL